MTTKPSNLITVGRITGVFGIKGWLKVKSWTEPEEQIVSYKPWWMKTRHGVKEMEIDDYLFRPQGLVVHIKGMDERDQAEALGQIDIAVEKQQLPKLTAGEYYWHQLQGLQVVSHYEGKDYTFGNVEKLMETGANDVLVVKPTDLSMDNKERVVPYVPDVYVKQVDLENGIIVVEWDPEF